MIRPPTWLIYPYFILGALPALALAQPTSVKVHNTVVLATYYELHQPNCLALRPPILRITQAPRLGSATVLWDQPQPAGAPGRCAYVSVPVVRVLYQGKIPGTDTLAWEVQYQSRQLGLRHYSARITVTPSR